MKVTKFVLISLLLSTSIYASDLLLKATNGAVSDSEVKVLSPNEMENVRGGLWFSGITPISYNENIVYAKIQDGIDPDYIKTEYKKALDIFSYDDNNLVAYRVKRDVRVSDRGLRYVVFTYGTGAYNENTKEYRELGSSAILNNNGIIAKIRDAYKRQMENDLGGWNAR